MENKEYTTEVKEYNFDNFITLEERSYEIKLNGKYVYITEKDGELKIVNITEERIKVE